MAAGTQCACTGTQVLAAGTLGADRSSECRRYALIILLGGIRQTAAEGNRKRAVVTACSFAQTTLFGTAPPEKFQSLVFKLVSRRRAYYDYLILKFNVPNLLKLFHLLECFIFSFLNSKTVVVGTGIRQRILV